MSLSEYQKQAITLVCITVVLLFYLWWNSNSVGYMENRWESECGLSESKQCVICDNTISISACVDSTKTFSTCYTQAGKHGHCDKLFYELLSVSYDATLMSYIVWGIIVCIFLKLCDIFQAEWLRIRSRQNNSNSGLYQPLASNEQQPNSNYAPFANSP